MPDGPSADIPIPPPDTINISLPEKRLPPENELPSKLELLQTLMPPQVITALVKDKELRTKLKQLQEGEKIDIPILPDTNLQRNQAHAFQFTLHGFADSDKQQVINMLFDYFAKHEQSGFVLRARGDSVKGFLTPTSVAEFHKVLVHLQLLSEEISKLKKDQQADFIFLIADNPLNSVSMYHMGSHYVLDGDDTALTNLSWAAKQAYDEQYRTQLGKNNHVVMVSPEKTDKKREEINLIIEDRLSHFEQDPVIVKPPAKKAASAIMHLRSAAYSVENSASWQQAIETFAKADQSVVDRLGLKNEDPLVSELLSYSVAGFNINMDDLKSKHWLEISQYKPNEFLEFKVHGYYEQLKFDFSGMSKLITLGKNPGDVLRKMFAEFSLVVDNTLQRQPYLLGVEGDALVMYILTPETATHVERINSMITLHSAIVQKYSDFMAEAIKNKEFDGLIGEHEFGLKLFVQLSKESTSIQLRRGFHLIKDIVFDKYEHLEDKAKMGGHTGIILSDEQLPESQIPDKVHLGNASYTEKGYCTYLLHQESLFEDRMRQYLQQLPDGIREKALKLLSYIDRQLDDLENLETATNSIGEEIDRADNNHITTAKLLLIFQRLHKYFPQIVKQLESQDIVFSKRSRDFIKDLWNNGHIINENETDDPQKKGTIKAFKALSQLQLEIS